MRKVTERLVSESSDVLLEEADSVAIIRIDDGKVNAFTEELLSSLSEALDFALAQNRAALILGNERCLSAGFELSAMRADADTRRSLVLSGLELALKIFESPIPVVVGCTGHAIAAGTLLLFGADHVVVGEGPVKIGLNETTIGIELSPFVLELARYRLLPSAYNQILRGQPLRSGSRTPGRLCRRGRRVRTTCAPAQSKRRTSWPNSIRSAIGGRRRR